MVLSPSEPKALPASFSQVYPGSVENNSGFSFPLFDTRQQNPYPQLLPAPRGCQMDGGDTILGGKVGVNNSTLGLCYYCHYSGSVQ